MRHTRGLVVVALAALAALGVPAAAQAWTEVQIPGNGGSGSNFTDPDQHLDEATRNAQSNGTGGNSAGITFGSGTLSFSHNQPGGDSRQSQYGTVFGPGWSGIGQ